MNPMIDSNENTISIQVPGKISISQNMVAFMKDRSNRVTIYDDIETMRNVISEIEVPVSSTHNLDLNITSDERHLIISSHGSTYVISTSDWVLKHMIENLSYTRISYNGKYILTYSVDYPSESDTILQLKLFEVDTGRMVLSMEKDMFNLPSIQSDYPGVDVEDVIPSNDGKYIAICIRYGEYDPEDIDADPDDLKTYWDYDIWVISVDDYVNGRGDYYVNKYTTDVDYIADFAFDEMNQITILTDRRDDSNMIKWNPFTNNDNNYKYNMPYDHTSLFIGTIFSPDGNYFAYDRRNRVTVIDIVNKVIVKTFDVKNDYYYVKWSNDNKYISYGYYKLSVTHKLPIQ